MSTALDNLVHPRAAVEATDKVVIFHASDTHKVTVSLVPNAKARYDVWARHGARVSHTIHSDLGDAFAVVVEFLEAF